MKLDISHDSSFQHLHSRLDKLLLFIKFVWLICLRSTGLYLQNLTTKDLTSSQVSSSVHQPSWQHRSPSRPELSSSSFCSFHNCSHVRSPKDMCHTCWILHLFILFPFARGLSVLFVFFQPSSASVNHQSWSSCICAWDFFVRYFQATNSGCRSC